MSTKPLSCFCSINMGQSPDSSFYNKDKNGIPFFQGNADFGEITPSERIWCEKPTKIAEKGDILISVRAPVGALNIANNTCCIGRGLAALTPKADKCYLMFLFYALKSKKEYLEKQSTGSTFKAINRRILETLEIPSYSLSEQRKILGVLVKIDSLISNQHRKLAVFDNLIKSRFIEMFGDPGINPFKWDTALLGHICDVRDGTHDSPCYIKYGYPLVTSKNISGGTIAFDGCNYISEKDFNKINERSKVDIGDIIMPMIGTVGNPVIVDTKQEFAIKNVALIKFDKKGRVTNHFIKNLLISDYFDSAVFNKIRGGTQKFLSLGDIRSIQIYLPTLELQQKFDSFVTQVDKSKYGRIVEVLLLLKTEILKKGFSGSILKLWEHKGITQE